LFVHARNLGNSPKKWQWNTKAVDNSAVHTDVDVNLVEC